MATADELSRKASFPIGPLTTEVGGAGCPARQSVGFGARAAASGDDNPTTAASRASRFKRWLDLILGSLALAMLSPLLLTVAALVKIDSSGPVIFKQRRSGLDGREFRILKFRTMHVMEDGASVAQARCQDSRVTRVGRLLRRSSLDELPQLINIIKGEMSLVGPRPHPISLDDKFQGQIPSYVLRFTVKPGLTGWAQVNGARGETAQLVAMEKRVALDLWYIKNWSPALDLKIILRTLIVIWVFKAF
jgi:undecaprenyl-phosphate galactose phosphotransferase/putative colanic acid biosynthesis UDP-glucose lipid carrier transferase